MLSRLLLALVRSYQLLLSPLFGDCCRFEPSCSRYCSACLEHHGAVRGSWLSLKRLLRCNPLFAGGVDMPPLPPGADLRSIEPNWALLSQRIERASRASVVSRSTRALLVSPRRTPAATTPSGSDSFAKPSAAPIAGSPPGSPRGQPPFSSTTES